MVGKTVDFYSAENVIHGIDEFLYGGFGFIAHVGNAEGGAFDFTVAAVDEEVVLVLQILDECGEIKARWRGEAGEGERAAAFRSKEFEAMLGTPRGDHRIGLGMACAASGKAFFGDSFQDELKAEQK